jgi:hypothetical protein
MRYALLLIFAPFLHATAQDTRTLAESAAIDAITQLGGKADTDTRLAKEARVVAKFEAPTDIVLANLKKYPQIGAVEIFDGTKCTERGLAVVKSLPHLHKVVIEKAALSANSLAAIGACKELRHLALVNSGVSDTELARLKDLSRLEHLALSENPKVTDTGMATVKTSTAFACCICRRHRSPIRDSRS